MRVKAVAVRVFKQLVRDKRTLALMLIAPLFVMTLLALVFNGKAYHPDIALVSAPESVAQNLAATNAKTTKMTASEAYSALKDNNLDAVISFHQQTPTLTLEGSDPTANRAVLQIIRKTAGNQGGTAESAVHYLHGGKGLTTFDNFGPILLGFFVFFFVFLISGISFLRERTDGTLERLMASPLRRWELVAGYLLGFGIFTVIQSALIVWFAVNILNLWMVGSFWYVLLTILLLAFSALALGTLLSAFAQNELQMFQFIPLVIVPQVFFSGVFQIETISDWVRWIGPLTPLYYAAEALRDMMLRDAAFADVAGDLAILLGFAVVFIILNVLALRRYRRL